MTDERDRQRSKVYAWEERFVAPYDPTTIVLAQAQGMVDAIWTEMGLHFPPKVEPLPRQVRSTMADANRLTIRLADICRSWWRFCQDLRQLGIVPKLRLFQGEWSEMRCPACGSRSIRERPERTTQGYRRFRCRCGKQFNERSAGVLNKAQYPSDVIALVVLWRLRYKLSLRDLAEMFLTRGFVFTYEPVREWEAKLTPALAENLRRKRKGRVGPSWYVDEGVPQEAA